MSNDKPEVGQKAHLADFGDVEVTRLQKRGKPPKDGSWGGKVFFADMDGVEREIPYRVWLKAAKPNG